MTRDKCCGFMPPITAHCRLFQWPVTAEKRGRETAGFTVDGPTAHADRSGQKRHLVGCFEDLKGGPEMAQTLLKEKAKNA